MSTFRNLLRKQAEQKMIKETIDDVVRQNPGDSEILYNTAMVWLRKAENANKPEKQIQLNM